MNTEYRFNVIVTSINCTGSIIGFLSTLALIGFTIGLFYAQWCIIPVMIIGIIYGLISTGLLLFNCYFSFRRCGEIYMEMRKSQKEAPISL